MKTLLYTVVLIATIALTLTLMTVGDRLLALRRGQLPPAPASAAVLWAQLRFPVAAVAGYFALFFLYALSQDGRQPWRNIWPGTLAALVAWLVLSLAVLHLCGELCPLLRAVRLHRHGDRAVDLAVYDRRDPYHGGGAERHADLPAKGPGGERS